MEDWEEQGLLYPGQKPTRSAILAWQEDGAKLYAIACGNRVKVGVSHDPNKRVRGIAAEQRLPSRLIGSVEVPRERALTAESYAHWLLRDRHQHNEWFDAEHSDALTAIYRSAEEVGAGLSVPAFVKPRMRNGKPTKGVVMISRVDRPRPPPSGRPSRIDLDDEIDGSL